MADPIYAPGQQIGESLACIPFAGNSKIRCRWPAGPEPCASSLESGFAENENVVGPAEAEGCGHDRLESGGTCHVRNVVEVQLGIGHIIDRWWDNLVEDRPDAHSRLDRCGRTQAVSQ